MRLPLAILIASAVPAFAQELPRGTYALQIDGGVGRAAVIDRLARISIGGSGCAGGIRGVLASEAPDAWEINLDTDAGLCTVAITRQGSGYAVGETNCWQLHGAACSFSGSMTQTGGSSDASAMREAFESFGPGERMAIQDVLSQLGLYAGRVDGAYGPATAAALAQLP